MSQLMGFLFARPSFIEGMARVLDMGGTLQEYNQSLTPDQADNLAFRADWDTIMAELRMATEQFSVSSTNGKQA